MLNAVLTEKVTIGNKMGLHARPAAKLASIAGGFSSALKLKNSNGSEADCRSVLSMLMLAACKGTELEIVASGDDASDALRAVSEYFKNNFDEN
jgi:phosphocarrier protein